MTNKYLSLANNTKLHNVKQCDIIVEWTLKEALLNFNIRYNFNIHEFFLIQFIII
jgi:hypothetical protein